MSMGRRSFGSASGAPQGSRVKSRGSKAPARGAVPRELAPLLACHQGRAPKKAPIPGRDKAFASGRLGSQPDGRQRQGVLRSNSGHHVGFPANGSFQGFRGPEPS